jgi:aspartyl-tRNA synthetase
MLRTKTCGELRLENLNQSVTLAGWVQKNRKFGGMTFIYYYHLAKFQISSKLCLQPLAA